MIRLPVRSPQVANRFIPAAYQSVTVDSAAYDQGGSALAAAGKSLGALSENLDAVMQVQEREATSSALMQLEKGALELRQNSQVSLSEATPAVGQAEPPATFQQQYDDLEKRIIGTLPTGRAQRAFQERAFTIRQRFGALYDNDAAEVSRQQSIAAKQDASDTAKQVALVFRSDPQAFAEQIALGRSEVFNKGIKEGINDVAQLNASADQWEGGVYADLIRMQISDGTLEQAQKLFTEHKSLFDQKTTDELSGLFQDANDAIAAKPVMTPVLDDLNGWRGRLEAAPSSQSPAPEAGLRPTLTYGLHPQEHYLRVYDEAADKANLTESQRLIGRREVQKAYALARAEAKALRRSDLQLAYQEIESGSSPEQLNPLLRRRLGADGMSAVEETFQRQHGITRQATNPARLITLTSGGEQGFQDFVLPEIQPYVSKGLYDFLEKTQSMMASDNLVERAHGNSVWRAFFLAVSIIGKEKIKDSANAEALIVTAVSPVFNAIKSGTPYSQQDIADALIRKVTTLRRSANSM